MNKDTVIKSVKNGDVTSDRHLYIGGSDIPSILNKSTFGDVYDLTVGKFRDVLNLPPEEEKPYMDKYIEYGNVMEAKIRKWYNRKNGLKLLEASAYNTKEGYRANVDGYDMDRKVLCEIKTHGDTIRIEEYEMQCQFYMLLFGVKEVTLLMYEREKSTDPMEYFVQRFDSQRLTEKTIKRDEKFIELMIESINKYTSVCQQFINSDGKMTREEVNNAMIDETIKNELVKQSQELALLESVVEEYEKKKAEYDDLKKSMLASMEENGVYSLETTNYKFSHVAEGVSNSFDKKALEKDHPDLVTKYTKTKKRKSYIKMTRVKKLD